MTHIREIFKHYGVTSYTGDLRTLFEIRNERDAYELFLTAYNKRRSFDEILIKEFQKCLTRNTYDMRIWPMQSLKIFIHSQTVTDAPDVWR